MLLPKTRKSIQELIDRNSMVGKFEQTDGPLIFKSGAYIAERRLFSSVGINAILGRVLTTVASYAYYGNFKMDGDTISPTLRTFISQPRSRDNLARKI